VGAPFDALIREGLRELAVAGRPGAA
jgi:hypothetical protein